MSKYGSGKGILRQSNDGSRNTKKSASFASSPTSFTTSGSQSPAVAPSQTETQPSQKDQGLNILQNTDLQPLVNYSEYPSYFPQVTSPYTIGAANFSNMSYHRFTSTKMYSVLE
jgi:hypothetical protein